MPSGSRLRQWWTITVLTGRFTPCAKSACGNQYTESTRSKVLFESVPNSVWKSSVMKGDTATQKLRNEVILTEPLLCNSECPALSPKVKRVVHSFASQLRQLNPAQERAGNRLRPVGLHCEYQHRAHWSEPIGDFRGHLPLILGSRESWLADPAGLGRDVRIFDLPDEVRDELQATFRDIIGCESEGASRSVPVEAAVLE